MHKVETFYTGVAGAVLLDVVHQVQTPTPAEINSILQMVGQLVIIIGTIWKIFKKEKPAAPAPITTPTEINK